MALIRTILLLNTLTSSLSILPMHLSLNRLADTSAIWKHPGARKETVVKFQDQALRRLIQFACEHVDFYRAKFAQAGIKPEDISGISDISYLPFTTKAELRGAAPDSIIAHTVNQNRLVRYSTSGSTGEPFIIRRTALENHQLELYRKRAQWQFGLRPWHKIVAIKELPITGNQHLVARRILNTFRLYRKNIIDCYQPKKIILEELARQRPKTIAGYPNTLALIGKYLQEQNRTTIRPQRLLCGGEPLTSTLRNKIESYFQAPLFEGYGAHEFNLIAWQCPHNTNLHVCDDSVWLEVIRDGQPVAVGESGEVVITGLVSYSMPFIRYKIGDLATRGPQSCTCGQPFSTIYNLIGRTADYFEFPDGCSIHPFTITGPLLETSSNWIDRYQLIHESADRLILRIVPLIKPQPEQLDEICRLGLAVLPEQVRLDVELVNDIAAAPSGKFQTYVNRTH